MMVDCGTTRLYVLVFFALLTSKTRSLYNTVFRMIMQSTAQRRGHAQAMRPAIVHCDFEPALISTVEECFPTARIVGCLFHFMQACSRRTQKCRIPHSGINTAMP